MLIQILIIFGVTIVALIFVFRLVFRRDLDVAMKRLKGLQGDAVLREKTLRDELDRAKLERALQVKKGKEEAEGLIRQAKEEAEALRSEVKESSDQIKKNILAAGEQSVEKLKKNFTREVEKEAAKVAMDMIRGVFTGDQKEKLQSQFQASVGTFG